MVAAGLGWLIEGPLGTLRSLWEPLGMPGYDPLMPGDSPRMPGDGPCRGLFDLLACLVDCLFACLVIVCRTFVCIVGGWKTRMFGISCNF